MAETPDGCCKEFYERGRCRYGGSCRFSHIRKEDAHARTCPECKRPSEEMCMPDCGHVFCMECSVRSFNRDGRCRRCGEETEGRFFVL